MKYSEVLGLSHTTRLLLLSLLTYHGHYNYFGTIFFRLHLLKCKIVVMKLLHKLSCNDYTSEVNCPIEAQSLLAYNTIDG